MCALALNHTHMGVRGSVCVEGCGGALALNHIHMGVRGSVCVEGDGGVL